MKKNKLIILTAMVVCFIVSATSCSEEKEILVPYPKDITFEDIQLDKFTYNIPNAAFTAGDNETGVITANVINNGDGTFSGFAPSNRNLRHYPWNLSPDFEPAGGLTPAQKTDEINSTVMSCMTYYPSHSGNFLVGTTHNDDAYITLNSAAVVEHILVTNTSFSYLTGNYGSVYSGTYDATTGKYDIDGTPVRNINIDNPSTDRYGRFYLPNHNGDELVKLSFNSGYYVKLTIKGYNGGTQTGAVDFYLAVDTGVNPDFPAHKYILNDWRKVDLTSLGTVDKLVFNITSSYDKAPKYFCLDGVRIKK